MAEGFVSPTKGGAYLKLRVSPGAQGNAVKGMYGEGAIRLSVAAPPVGGRANAEVERYLATLVGVARSRVTVVKGHSSRDKVLFVSGLKPEAIGEGLVSLVR